MRRIVFALASVLVLAASAFAQQQNNGSVNTTASNGAPPVPSVPLIQDVVSDPRWVMTVPVGETRTIQFRALLSDGRSTSDFSTLPLQFNFGTDDGTANLAQLVSCKHATAQCVVRSDKPRVLYLYVSQGGGLGYGSLVVNFYRPIQEVMPATIDISSSQSQANDNTTPTLTITSPITSRGPVTIQASTQYTNEEPVQKYIYLPDGVQQGQRILINTEEVRPLSFRGRRNFAVYMNGSEGYTIAQGFGSSVSTSESKTVDAVVDENGDLVVTLFGGFNPAVEYTVAILRGDRFRVELSSFRNEVFAYAYGDKTRLVFNRGSLGENRYQLPHGFYTVSVNARDRSAGVGWSNSRADALSVYDRLVLR